MIRNNIDTIIIGIIMCLAFFEGALSLTGIPESGFRMLREFFTYLIFYIAVLKYIFKNKSLNGTSKSFYFFGYKIIIIFLFISLISFLLNQKSNIEYFLFFRKVITPIIFFWSILILDFNYIKIFKLLKFLIVFQIPAVFFKFLMLGISESGGIGTISIHSGSLSTIFPLCIISILLSRFICRSEKSYIFYIFLYLLFGLIGGKRALLFFLPILVLFLFFINQLKAGIEFKPNFFIKLGNTFFFILFLFYSIAKLNPNLNPEKKIWGSFSIKHILSISVGYNTAQYELGFSRFDAPKIAFNFLIKNDYKKVIFGLGPGDIIQSSLNNKYSGVKNDRQLIMRKYGLGYGLRTGAIWIGLQVGLLGSLVFSIFFIRIATVMSKLYTMTCKVSQKENILSIFGIIFVILLDYFTYSNTFFNIGAISYSFFVYCSIVFKNFSLD